MRCRAGFSARSTPTSRARRAWRYRSDTNQPQVLHTSTGKVTDKRCLMLGRHRKSVGRAVWRDSHPGSHFASSLPSSSVLPWPPSHNIARIAMCLRRAQEGPPSPQSVGRVWVGCGSWLAFSFHAARFSFRRGTFFEIGCLDIWIGCLEAACLRQPTT